MTVLAAPYTLLRRDGEARISRADPPHRPMELPLTGAGGTRTATQERRGGLLRPEVARLIAERSFTMAFQPVVRLADRRVVSHEALLRLRLPPGAPAQPTRAFVDAAQGWDLGTALDEAALDVTLATWPRDAATPVSVNVSARSLRDPLFFARLLRRVTGEGANIAVEISGLATHADLPAVVAVVPALNVAGVRVVLDDFGPAEAALTAVQTARFDEVKVSGAVVGDAVAGERGRRLLRALVTLAEAAGARTVAKLIETEPQAALLRSLGLGYGQGWLFGAPALLKRDRRMAA
jgi:EAL domain-containing protein (putative c-di-GMP-specific phosphodiesterase class I)